MTPKLTYDVYIAASPDRVWSALTDGGLTEQYFYGTRVKSAFERGAKIDYLAGDMKRVEGEIVSVKKGQALVMSQRMVWDDKVKADPASQVAWELEAAGEATHLRLVHDGFTAENETFKQSAQGWPVILSGMKTLLETGKPLKLPSMS
jgi:uncharacterized protein YndB with AHSA1/START domain